jgi:hypothetical protein
MRAKFLIAAIALFVGLAGTAYAGLFSDSWRYKMTVEVETPEGLRTGSAVREVTVHKGLKLTPEMTTDVSVRGEAVVVDLGKRGILFMLVDGDYGANILFKFFPGNEKKGKVALTPEQYPNFVRFGDLSDPKTIENIRRPEELNKFKTSDPRRPVMSFESAFGSGVEIKQVTIEITSDPVTWGIEKYLPWVLKISGGNLGGGRFSGPEWYERLDKWEFKRE